MDLWRLRNLTKRAPSFALMSRIRIQSGGRLPFKVTARWKESGEPPQEE
jgi:hypothetical protein